MIMKNRILIGRKAKQSRQVFKLRIFIKDNLNLKQILTILLRVISKTMITLNSIILLEVLQQKESSSTTRISQTLASKAQNHLK